MKKLFASALAIAVVSISLGNVSCANVDSDLSRYCEFDLAAPNVLPPPDLALHESSRSRMTSQNTAVDKTVKVLPPPDLALRVSQHDKIKFDNIPASERVKVLPPPDSILQEASCIQHKKQNPTVGKKVDVLSPPDLSLHTCSCNQLKPENEAVMVCTPDTGASISDISVSKTRRDVLLPPDNIPTVSANINSASIKGPTNALHSWTTRPILSAGNVAEELLTNSSSIKTGAAITTTLFSKITKESASKVFSWAAPIAMLTIDGFCGCNLIKSLCADVAISYLVNSIKSILP